MSRRKVSQSIDPYSRTEQVVSLRKVKHCIKDTIDDIADERSAARGFQDSMFINWKSVNNKLDRHLQILSSPNKSKNKTRAKAPKDLCFYVYPGHRQAGVQAVKVSIVTGTVFCFVGAGAGAAVGRALDNRVVEGVVNIFYDFDSSSTKGLIWGAFLGLTCGMGMGLVFGYAATSLYMFVRRIRIPVSDVFARFSDCVSDDMFVHTTIDVTGVDEDDLSSDD
jgi:hypothetical protein